MLLVYKNVEIFCNKENITLELLLDKLDISQEIYFSTKKTKAIINEQNEGFERIATYFHVSVEELKNRFWDEPEIVWKLSSDKTAFFTDLQRSFKAGESEWSLLNKEDAWKTILSAKGMYFDSEKIYRFIAFKHVEKEFSAYIFEYITREIDVDMYNCSIGEESQRQSGRDLVMIIPEYKNLQFFGSAGNDAIANYINETFETLLDWNRLKSTDSWYLNDSFHFDICISYSSSYTIDIDCDDNGLFFNSNREHKEKDSKSKIPELLKNLRESYRIPEEDLKELEDQLYSCQEDLEDEDEEIETEEKNYFLTMDDILERKK